MNTSYHRSRNNVINALRHQRLVHTLSLNIIFLPLCDQRLTASKVSTLECFCLISFFQIRDQRLTASKVSTQSFGLIFPFMIDVINALRHQRLVHCPTSYRAADPDQCDQRLTASKVSTRRFPSGAKIDFRVINALRHQRLVHSIIR